ncbi:hypothetical protein BGZ68_003709 [Mortierella alpina]|nr:hypothetical protein BGZ68_003709 [Mortierella alpina]
MLPPPGIMSAQCVRRAALLSIARVALIPVAPSRMSTSRSGAFMESQIPWRALSTRKSSVNRKGNRTSTSQQPLQKSTHNEAQPLDQTSHKTSSVSTAATPSKPKKSSKKSTAQATAAKSPSKKLPLQPPASSEGQSAVQQSIPDYKHSKTPPQQDLDNLQILVHELLSTNSSVSKRDILARHPAQAPLLAWIYDPLRQFHVTSSNVSKYAQLRAKQRDESSTVAAASAATSSIPDTSSLDQTLDARSIPDVPSGNEEALYSNMSKKQRSEAVARATAIGRGYDTLSELLNALSTRAISGYTALDAILLFMDRFCKDNARSSSSSSSAAAPSNTTRNHQEVVKELFATPRAKLLLKILDKNLKTGCNVGLIREIYPTLIPGFHVALGHSLSQLKDARTLFPDQSQADTLTTVTKADRGKTVQSSGATAGETKGAAVGWYASRKLDGVRCLVRIDRATGGIETLSRHGRGFESLGRLQDALRILMRTSNGDEQRGRDLFFARAVGQELGQGQTSEQKGQELPDSLILDGEVCVFVKESEVQSTVTDQGSEDLQTGTQGDDEFGRENFSKAISAVKRGLIEDDSQEQSMGDQDVEGVHGDRNGQGEDSLTGAMELDTASGADAIVYCLFDCLTDKEFGERSGSRPFSARINGLTEALLQNPSRTSSVASARALIRVLHQTRIESFPQLEKMVTKGMERGWEGVMLRKDVGYEGKRSRNLLKIKQFQEAEFTVEEAMLGSMRLAFEGEYQERDNVLTNVVVLHRGNRVRVGSGFSVEDRIRFGKDPNLIIGKTITVRFFEESKTLANGAATTSASSTAATDNVGEKNTPSLVSTNDDATATKKGGSRSEDSTDTDGDGAGAVWSLRFPTVKAIYGSGPRQL